jgi:hypothetical protein
MRSRWPASSPTRSARSRCAAFGLGLAFAIATPGLAQPATDGTAAKGPCVDVRVGSDESYACLSRELQKLIPQERASSADAPISATSPAPQVGTFNEAATRQFLGSNFGKSAIPQRPPPPVFISPLVPMAPR